LSHTGADAKVRQDQHDGKRGARREGTGGWNVASETQGGSSEGSQCPVGGSAGRERRRRMKAGVTRYQPAAVWIVGIGSAGECKPSKRNGREPIPHGEYSSADIELGRRIEAQLIAEARRVALGCLIEKARAGGVFLPASILEMLL